ncbi:TonB-dependent siderophore receptor [Xanthobacter pseudotagetidis]|uniref:TonB-dependent siderophore receptor n=1 Tax=Xanthobacter pseudotagetidis TaxID=3119911 RepID=UPI00372993E2
MLPTLTVENDEQSAWGPVDGYIAETSAVGTKTDTPILATPRAISVVTREEMEDRGARTVVDAVGYTAGVVSGTYGYDPPFDSIYIRGFPVTANGDFLDGLRQGAGLLSRFRTEVYGLERIDIIKGPAAVLYGQMVPGGLINRISRMPVDRTFHEVQGQAGDPDWLQAAFDFGGRATEDASVLYRFTGVARDADGPRAHTDNNEIYLAPAVTFQNDTTRLTVLANILDAELPSSRVYYQPGGVLTKAPVGTSFNLLDQTQQQIGYRLEHDLNDAVTVRQNLRYGRIDNTSSWLLPTGTERGPYVGVYAISYKEVLDIFQVDTQIQARFAAGPIQHKVLAGLDYTWGSTNYGRAYSTMVAPLNLLDPNAPNVGLIPRPAMTERIRVDQLGLYVQDQMEFGDGWHFTIAGRQDFTGQQQTAPLRDVSAARDERTFTWQAGLLYEFDFGLSPYVSYATSFLPSYNLDQFGALLPSSTGEQYEAGVKYQPRGSRSLFTAAAYQITQSNYAVQDPVNLYYTAVGNVRVRGFEAEALVQLADGLDLTAAYTFTRGEIIGGADAAAIGKTPVNMPENVASLWLKYTVLDGPAKGFGFGAGIRYIGAYWADHLNTYKNSAQFPVDAALYYAKDNWRLALNARNLFDQQEALENEGAWYWQQGRTVIASATYRW